MKLDTTLAVQELNAVAEYAKMAEDIGSEVDLSRLEPQLMETLPRFREKFRDLGEAFSRGDWRGGLEPLSQLLEELQIVREGLCMSRSLQGQAPVDAESFEEVVRALDGHVRSQSWVEVSDVLLYELEPLLEQWESGEPATSE